MFNSSLIYTHTYVCNYEHIVGVILIIIWDSNINCSEVKPQSLHRDTKTKTFRNGLYLIITTSKKRIK